MVNVKGYISSNFSNSFFTIFLPFFIIISLVFLVRIAALTSQIQVSIGELLLLYSYSIPEIIFYTLPLSFISALTNLLIKLSQDNELIALYALGLKSSKILHSLVILSLFFTLLLASLSILAMPLSKQLYKAFQKEKQTDAKLNIIAGKLGQKFGNYYIYVKENKKNVFHDIVIYNRTDNESEQFFSSKTGQLRKDQNITSLFLNEGYGYTYSESKMQQAQYKTLEIFDSAQKKDFIFKNLTEYWSRLKDDIRYVRKILFLIFVSFIPILSVYLIASFAMINPRYQKNRSFLIIFITTLSLYLVASSLQKWGTPLTLVLSIIFIFLLGRWLFHKRVARYF